MKSETPTPVPHPLRKGTAVVIEVDGLALQAKIDSDPMPVKGRNPNDNLGTLPPAPMGYVVKRPDGERLFVLSWDLKPLQ